MIAYPILGLFLDVKTMILIGLYIGTCASLYILITDHRSFDSKIFRDTLPICLVGTVIGVLIFSKSDPQTLSIIFGLFLIFLSVKMNFFGHFKLPKTLKGFLFLISGISHGIFGIGGPFLISALKDDFKNKSIMRSTMAVFFVTFNLVRFIQLTISNQFTSDFFIEIWWMVIPVFFAIKLGYKIHLKINELIIKKVISIMIFCAGIQFLLRY